MDLAIQGRLPPGTGERANTGHRRWRRPFSPSNTSPETAKASEDSEARAALDGAIVELSQYGEADPVFCG